MKSTIDTVIKYGQATWDDWMSPRRLARRMLNQMGIALILMASTRLPILIEKSQHHTTLKDSVPYFVFLGLALATLLTRSRGMAKTIDGICDCLKENGFKDAADAYRLSVSTAKDNWYSLLPYWIGFIFLMVACALPTILFK